MTLLTLPWRLIGILLLLSSTAFGQPASERIPVPLTDPNRPVFLNVGLISGGITVKGYAGKEVIVEATRAPDDDDNRPQEKTSGKMKLIPNTSIGLTAEEEDNTVSISTGLRGISQQIDLVIQVPSACSMKLSTVNGGDIQVENVNGEVRVEFTKVTADKAMSFISLNGDIDVTFPASLKATVQLKSEQGEIYSDFDVQMQKSDARVDKNERGKGKYRVTVEKTMRGTINGGGQEIHFSNFNGSIYIRKGS